MTVGLVKLEQTDTKLESAIGIFVKFQDARGKGIPCSARDYLIYLLLSEASKNKDFDWSGPFLEIKMPCNHSVIYESSIDIPVESVPCSCGDPAHWFIKYEAD